jgi:hypothetical protein
LIHSCFFVKPKTDRLNILNVPNPSTLAHIRRIKETITCDIALNYRFHQAVLPV